MTDIHLRSATCEDASAIKSLVRSARINPTGLDWRRFVVAVSPEREIIGCGQIKPHRDGSHELASLVVKPEWRNQGIGGIIMEHLSASHEGPLYLMCRSSLGPFYEKFGFGAIQPPDMPKYFRRITKLTKVIERLRAEGESLLVMKR